MTQNAVTETIRICKDRNMNKEWSELNKTMQAQIKKKDTYKMGISL